MYLYVFWYQENKQCKGTKVAKQLFDYIVSKIVLTDIFITRFPIEACAVSEWKDKSYYEECHHIFDHWLRELLELSVYNYYNCTLLKNCIVLLIVVY